MTDEPSSTMAPHTLSDFTARLPDGTAFDLSTLKGQVVLVVNTASRCGFTPQYAGLEALWQQHREAGFHVLAFPCNQFGAQEPGTADEIASFCTINFGVTFPIMDKVKVNGAEADPLFTWLKHEAPGVLGTEAIKWNFTKFLVDRSGHVVKRYAPNDAPEKIAKDIAALL
jgi:glutathione peroxidase